MTDWELILVNNNADAASTNIATDWCTRDQRVRVVSETHQGIAFALNTGLRHAATHYIARMDADDVCHPQRLEKQHAYLQRHPDIGVVGCRCEFVSTLDASSGYAEFVAWQNNIITPEQHSINRFVESPIAHPSTMFRKNLIDAYGAYDTGPIPEDYELWLRWLDRGVRFAKLDDTLLTWRDGPNRLSRTHANYANAAFFDTKMKYLATWLKAHVDPTRRIVICGTGKLARDRAAVLRSHGVAATHYTDVKQRGTPNEFFIPVDGLGGRRDLFFVNFISKRNVREDIRTFLNGLGFFEPIDFVLAA